MCVRGRRMSRRTLVCACVTAMFVCLFGFFFCGSVVCESFLLCECACVGRMGVDCVSECEYVSTQRSDTKNPSLIGLGLVNIV